MTQITTNGHTYSDDGSAALDMGNGGHKQWLLPMLGDVMHDTSTVNASAAAASASASAAANSAAAILATSTTSLLVATGSKTFTTQAGKQFAAGQWITATSAANSANQMYGQVASYSGSTLVVSVTNIYGAGTYADWNISLSAPQPTAVAGVAGLTRSARTSNTILGVADKGALVDITSGTFTQTFGLAASLLNGWWCYYRNSGTGDITISGPIDGISSFVMYSGEMRLIQCDGSLLRSVVITSFSRHFTTSGSFIKPPGYTSIWYKIVSGSGGGGSGRRGDESVIWGGSGGGGGGMFVGDDAGLVAPGTSLAVTVGAAGVGGAAQTVNSTDGLAGASGGTSSLIGGGVSISVTGGGGGSRGGTGVPASTVGGGVGTADSTRGINNETERADFGGGGVQPGVSNGVAGTALPSNRGGAGGGGGCGYAGTPTSTTSPGTSTFGNAGASGGTIATAGSNSVRTNPAAPGGGGGGGGASRNGTNSGKGGDGLPGFVTIWGNI